MSHSFSKENAPEYGRKSNTPAVVALVFVLLAIGLVGWYAFVPVPPVDSNSTATPPSSASTMSPKSTTKEASPN